MHDTTAWHWPAVPSANLISLSTTATSSPSPFPAPPSSSWTSVSVSSSSTSDPTSWTPEPTSTDYIPEFPTPISTGSAVTADGGVPLAQSVDGAGAGFVDGPDSEGQNTAAEVAATDSEGDAALPETQPDAVPEGGADGEAEAAPGGKSDAEPDGDGTALAMSGSSGPVVINPSSSIKNVSSTKWFVGWSIICLVVSQIL